MSQRKICPFFQAGNCRYGSKCRNLHIKSSQEDLKSFISPGSLNTKTEEIKKNVNSILPDVRNGAVLTSYSLAPPANVNLISGRDMSFEELRLQYYQNKDSAVFEYNCRKQDMIKCLERVKTEAYKGARYLQLAAEKPPQGVKSFIDFPIDMNAQSQPNAFGAPRQNSPFGAPATSNAFGGASISNPFQSSATAKPNPFGANSIANPFQSAGSSAFGTASNTGPFGRQTATAPANPFGSSSTAPSAGASAFGQSGFGQASSPFGSAAAKPNPFGSASTNPAPSPFGATSHTAQPTSGFGQSGFGAFGSQKVSPFNQVASQPAKPTPFGQTSSSPFGQPSTTPAAPAGAFGQSSGPFGQLASNSNSSTLTNNSPFGQPFGNSAAASEPFKQAGLEEPQTQLADLPDSVINEFKADKFTIGQIPDVPPPLEMR
ncbi:hypothetical protein OGAPHI_004088 [Ogataea philodendri]|uniref:C3H1-type domain-containing protein n=1 Tax=Ogataea philodendri TaxID=1378263 RepID=A0A9P8T538_9ASCO|nr:uncharacterized protein OGAPHI_004088 [Ogataea philodendri]KAH3665899.1 hypothetical protein OGAPHI_004088 [Ogataea philodendri]